MVALYVSAWIEIDERGHLLDLSKVALYVSAWIEIFSRFSINPFFQRRTLRECVD